jgi:acetyl-CoA carboxylase carboxyl transferase subunit alpha
MALLGKIPVMVVGHRKGRTLTEALEQNFGMPHPEGYRKSLRLMKMAEQFNMPILAFIDTAGAYPGIGAEERGQAEAIAKNILEMAGLRQPILSVVIGEGGSGGALALGVNDSLLMFQYSIYSVISPEGCASILWKDASKANTAAEILGITAPRLKSLGFVDTVVSESGGGAHSNPDELMSKLKRSFKDQFKKLQEYTTDELVNRRLERITNYGQFSEEQ